MTQTSSPSGRGPQSGATEIITDRRGRSRRRMQEFRLAGADGLSATFAAPLVRVGSHPKNDLVLADPSVSRFHLEIEAGPRGLLLRDLGSTNGSKIDGLQVLAAYLPAAAQLQLGQVSLRFSLTGAGAELETSGEESFHGLIGRSPYMRELFATLSRAAQSTATVLVEGESGTGKERIARALHQASPRAGRPFIVLDCAAIPRDLMESELFGHERGAFTGAVARSDGCFREADGGTLFLDEIGELPLEMQPKLLRVLETKQVRRLGAATRDEVDVRLVAATNRNLCQEVNRGTFREDLFYRLAVIQMKVPPLRERSEDVRALVEHFINELASSPRQADEILRGISPTNWRRLERQPWPGNARELRNFIERTLILSGGPIHTAQLEDLSAAQPESEGGSLPLDLDRPFTEHKAELVARFEKSYLLQQLERHEHNISAAARASGLDRMNFKRLLRKYR